MNRITTCLMLVFVGIVTGDVRGQTALTPAQQAQREEIKRQEAVLASQKAIDEADQLAIRGKIEEARGIIERVIATQSPAGEGAAVLENAQKLLVQISLKQGFDALKARNYLLAQQMAREVLRFDSRNPNGLRLLEDANAAMGLPIDNPEARNPAIDEGFIANVNRVTDLLKLGRDLVGTGQFDQAEKTFEQVLAIDPDNQAAARELQALQKKKGAILDLSRKVADQEKLLAVRQNWAERFVPEAQLEAGAAPVQPIRRSNRFGITEKLRTLIIPEINFQPGTTIDDAASFLTLRSRDVDPTKEGVSFLVKNEQARNEAKPFSLQLQNVPLGEALRYVTLLAGIKSRTEEFAVFFVPLSDRSENLVRREFRVQQDFFDTAPDPAATPAAGGASRRRPAVSTGTTVDSTAGSIARRALEARGVEFPEGATAVYSPATGILTVLNTQDQIDYIEELVTNTSDADTLMVRVESRFIEINQEDLDELSFNYAFKGTFSGDGIVGAPSRLTSGSASAQTSFQGAEGLGNNQVGQLLNQFPTTVLNVGTQRINRSQFMARGFLNGNQFALLVDALSQKKSFNVVTAPSIMVNDKATGTINVSREFRFPTTFDAPQIQERVTTQGGVITVRAPTVLPSWPSGFGQAPGDDGFEEIGVVATVTPEIQPTNQTIRVVVSPTIIQFDGFINYGTPINDPGEEGVRPPGAISENRIQIPVFSRRSIERSTVEIRDGYTLVMGGLIQENTDTLEEKFPILGDIPFIGRFFRSSAERSVKRNLLIFITVRIIRPNGDPLNVLPGELASR
ncbi:MAG: hypothetical protein OHK005_19010 [Candidatus Methylacidiphilales bacterium]